MSWYPPIVTQTDMAEKTIKVTMKRVFQMVSQAPIDSASIACSYWFAVAGFLSGNAKEPMTRTVRLKTTVMRPI